MRFLGIAAIALLHAAAVGGAERVQPTAAFELTVIDVHDGDSLRADIHLPFGIDLRNQPIRAYGYDAWELARQREQVIGKITDGEISKGKEARDDLKFLLTQGRLYGEDSGERDPHGRVSVKLYLKLKNQGWLDIADWMEAHGHLRTSRK